MFPSITDVLGVLVGHATDEKGGTGCTVVLAPEKGMPCTAYVKGRATGTRELDTCRPESLAGRADAILLAGGSAYGLAAADGVMRWLESRRRGFAVGPGVVPIVNVTFRVSFGVSGSYGISPEHHGPVAVA